MLSILVTATDEKLTVRENVKEVLDIADSKNDGFIDRLILRAGRRVQSYLGRSLALQKYQVLIPSYGGVNLQLPHYPIRDVFRVFDGSDTGLDLELKSTEYRIDKERGQLNRDDGFAWSRQVEHRSYGPAEVVVPSGEYKRWLVEYTAGYVLTDGLSTDSLQWSTQGGTTNTGPTLPDDIEDATIDIVRSAFYGRNREAGVVSEKVGDVTVRYGNVTESGLPVSSLSILDSYRSVI